MRYNTASFFDLTFPPRTTLFPPAHGGAHRGSGTSPPPGVAVRAEAGRDALVSAILIAAALVGAAKAPGARLFSRKGTIRFSVVTGIQVVGPEGPDEDGRASLLAPLFFSGVSSSSSLLLWLLWLL